MKTIFSIVLILFINNINAQMPVTDVATNSSLAVVNGKLAALNVELRQNNVLARETNAKLQRLIQLLERNNRISDDSKSMLSEELEAKKTTPNYVLNSSTIHKSQKLKSSILALYQVGVDLSQNLEHIDQNSINEFVSLLANKLLKTNELIVEANTILTTNSIINPEERISKIESINNELEDVLKSIKKNTSSIKHKNHSRASKKSLINLGKNQ